MGIAVVLVGLIILAIVGVLLYAAVASTTHLVPEDERLVINRLGSYHRLAGPGAVQIIAGIEEAVHTVNVSERLVEVETPDCSVYGLSAALTMKFWCKFDPVRTSRGNHQSVANLLRTSEKERGRLIELKAREAIVRQILRLQEQIPLPDKASREARLAALVPGSLRHNALLQAIKNDLAQSLLAIGYVISSTRQPAMIVKAVETEKRVEAPDQNVRPASPGDRRTADQEQQEQIGAERPPYHLTAADLAVLKPVPQADRYKVLVKK